MRKDRNKYIVSLGLLILYLVFQAGTSVFPHTHIIDGEKMVHSHPYSSAGHDHTSDQVKVIELLSSGQTLKVQIPFIQKVELPVLYELSFSEGPSILHDPYTRCVSLRAPPFC